MPKKVRSRKNKKVASRSRKNKKVVASRSRKMIKGGTPPKASKELLENIRTGLPYELQEIIMRKYLTGLRQRAKAHDLSVRDSRQYNGNYFYEIPLSYATLHDGITYVPVKVVPGVKNFESVMKKNDIIYAYELIGQFLVFKKNKKVLKEWLNDTINDTIKNVEQAIEDCVSSISEYVKINMEKALNRLDKNFISPKLVQNGITEPYQLVGQFWCFKQDEDMFNKWLNIMIESQDESNRITSEIKDFWW